MGKVIPNIFKITKRAILLFLDAAKHFIVDTGMILVSILAGVYWYFSPEASMVGCIAILFVYSSYTILRLNEQRKIINHLKLKNPEIQQPPDLNQ